MISRFLKYYKPHKRVFILDLLAAAAIAGIDLLFPIFTRTIINDIVPNRHLQTLLIFSVGLLVLTVGKLGLEYFTTYIGHYMGVKMQAEMREEVFKKLQRLPFSYYDGHHSGVIMSRVINDLFDVTELAHHGPEDLILSGVLVIGSFIYLLTVNVPLTLIIFLFIPILILYALRTRKKMSDAFRKTRVRTGQINAVLENSIAGVRVTRSFVNEQAELHKFEEGNYAFTEARRESYRAMAAFHSGLNFVMTLLNLGVLIGGGLFVYFEYINVGDFAAYLMFINTLLQPIRKLTNFVEQYQNGMSGFERFCEIMDEPEEADAPDARPLKNVQGHIKFEDVSFGYSEEDGSKVLNDITFEIEPGKTLALVGPSGGGKTTICQLIPRFYTPTEGRILVDGQDIAHVTAESLRSAIGLVQQDVFLFEGSVRDNILYGRPDATEEEIIQAAKSANIHNAILEMEDGYDTYVGERGVKLSGGQKQRLAIARVFLKNPPMLILDEATSALDNVTERYIQQSLQELCAGRTTIVVAHRLSTIKSADEIIVLTEDGVAERGTHDSLMQAGGVYASLQAR